MKKQYLLLICGLFVCFSCSKEAKITVELESYTRAYDVNSSDPVWKYVSQYFEDNDKTYITDADSSDYRYNFQNKNEIIIYPPVQEQDYILKSIELSEKIFMNLYSDNFKKNYFPYSLIIADSIINTESSRPDPLEPKGSRSFFAFTTNKKVQDMLGVELKSYVTTVNLAFFSEYILPNSRLDLPFAYYEQCELLFGTKADVDGIQEQSYGHERGFIKISSRDYDGTNFPSKNDDFKNMITYMIENDDKTINDFMSAYPILKDRYEILKNFFETEGFDYKALR